jgi:hypothetical protein
MNTITCLCSNFSFQLQKWHGFEAASKSKILATTNVKSDNLAQASQGSFQLPINATTMSQYQFAKLPVSEWVGNNRLIGPVSCLGKNEVRLMILKRDRLNREHGVLLYILLIYLTCLYSFILYFSKVTLELFALSTSRAGGRQILRFSSQALHFGSYMQRLLLRLIDELFLSKLPTIVHTSVFTKRHCQKDDGLGTFSCLPFACNRHFQMALSPLRLGRVFRFQSSACLIEQG